MLFCHESDGQCPRRTATASRDELENLSKREFDLLQTRDGLLAALPLMREERDQGYIKRDEAKYEYQEAARFIREHHYQRAFFQRTYENTGTQRVPLESGTRAYDRCASTLIPNPVVHNSTVASRREDR
jgi:hypothetical protein